MLLIILKLLIYSGTVGVLQIPIRLILKSV